MRNKKEKNLFFLI